MRLWSIPLLASLLAAPATANAQPDHDNDDDLHIEVAIFMLAEDGGMSSAKRATLLLTMERALRRDRRLEVVDKDRRLAERAGLVPKEVISEARGLLESGEAMLRKNRVSLALLRLQAAERQLGGGLAWVRKAEYARAQFLLGAAYAVLGNKKQAVAWFLRLQVWRSDFVVDTSIAPANVLPLWEKARKRVRRLAGGSVQLRSRPDRSLAYVDGRFVGFTPTTAEGLTAGEHYVTFKKLGYQRIIKRVTVSGTKEQRVIGRLTRSADGTVLTSLVNTVQRQVGKTRMPAEITEIGELLGVQHALFVITPESDSSAPYRVRLFDTRTRRLLASATAPLGKDLQIEEIFPKLSHAIYSQVVFKPKPKPKPKKKPKKKKAAGKPFYKKWWFWTGLTAVAATAVAVPLVLTAGGEDAVSCPPGSVCGDLIIDF